MTPGGAQGGAAGGGVCPLLPLEMIAHGQKFAAPAGPRGAEGRWPDTWQNEVIDPVTWWSRAIRTRVAQKKAVSAPDHDMVIRPPSNAGASTDVSARAGKSRSTRNMSRSAIRSGAKRSRLLFWRLNSQPQWAKNSPFAR